MTRSKHLLLYVSSLAVAVLVIGAASGANAQEAGRGACQDIGNPAPEPIGDREGHAIAVAQFSCKDSEGPLAGGVGTGGGIWEWDGPKAKLLSGTGVDRKPGAMNVFQMVDGTLELTMSEGKVTGWTASGHNITTLGTGSLASWTGKTMSWTAKATGLHDFEVSYTIK